jgi:hypothetical protein
MPWAHRIGYLAKRGKAGYLMGRKINFLGIEAEVMSEDEMAQAPPGTVYMLVRVDPVSDPETFRHASSELLRRRLRVRCDECRAICWFDPEGGWLSLPEGIERLCMQCLIVRAQAEKNDQS